MHPCDSRTIGGCKVRRTNYEMKIVEGKVLTKRCIRMDSGSDIVFIQLLHDYWGTHAHTHAYFVNVLCKKSYCIMLIAMIFEPPVIANILQTLKYRDE